MRRKTDKPLLIPLSPEQHALVLDVLAADDLSVNRYVRRLVAEDAARRGIDWPEVERSTQGIKIDKTDA